MIVGGFSEMTKLAIGLLSSSLLAFGACVPQAEIVPSAVKTSIEKTTVTVKDPQGNVLRIEEKEMVLQEYTAKEPVQLKTVAPPPVQKVHFENGKLVEDR
jgi:hypothetical protein